jgi:hypothetical protein
MTGIQGEDSEEDKEGEFNFHPGRSYETPSPIDRKKAKKTLGVTANKMSLKPVN